MEKKRIEEKITSRSFFVINVLTSNWKRLRKEDGLLIITGFYPFGKELLTELLRPLQLKSPSAIRRGLLQSSGPGHKRR